MPNLRGGGAPSTGAVAGVPPEVQPRTSPLTRTRLLRLLLPRLRERGVDLAGILARFDLAESAAVDEETIVPLATLSESFQVAEALLGDPALGIHMATDHQVGGLGLLEYTFRFAPTLREACQRVTRYVGLSNDLAQVAFDEARGVGRIQHWIAGHPMCLGRHANEFFMALLVLQMRKLTGLPIVPEAVWFAHPRPSDVAPIVAAFGTTKIEFGVEANGFSVSADTLATRLPTADPALLSILDRAASERLAANPQAKDFSGQVRRAIRERMTGVVPKLPAIADVFRMSERTFQRRLGDEGASYQQLVDAVREELARLHVAQDKLSFGEIAYLLGYAELSAFLRAFKRWAGVTPQQYRAHPPGAAPGTPSG